MPFPYDGPDGDNLDNVVNDPTGQGKKPPVKPGQPPITTPAPSAPPVTYNPTSNLDRHLSGGQTTGFKNAGQTGPYVPTDAQVLSPSDQLSMLMSKFHNGGYGQGQPAKDAFAEELGKFGYQPKDVKTIVDSADKARQVNIDPSTFQTAYAHGQITKEQLKDQLAKANMPADQISIFSDLADDAKENYTRTHAQDLANDKLVPLQNAETQAGLEQAARKRQFEQSHIMTGGHGDTSEFTKTPSDNLILGGYTGGQYDRGMAKAKLVNQAGYTDQDAETLLHEADQAKANPQGAGGAGGGNGRGSGLSGHSAGGGGTVNAAPGTREMHPQAQRTVQDFNTSFASGLQALSNQGAITPHAREWASQNRDMFMPGNLNGGNAVALNGQQIQTLYEGMGAGGNRAGVSKQQGTIQSRLQ